MPRILVWQCPKTRKLFEDKDLYLKHLRREARKSLAQRRQERLVRSFDERIKELHCAGSFDEIGQWLIENVELLALCNPGYRHSKEPVILSDIAFTRMRRNETISIASGAKLWSSTRNWDNIATIDTHLPGYQGRMYCKVFGHSFNLFRHTGIFTGTGSGNSHTGEHGMDVTLFDRDFPNLSFMERLNGEFDIEAFRAARKEGP